MYIVFLEREGREGGGERGEGIYIFKKLNIYILKVTDK
jgi:hypothetical protein